MNLWEQIMNFRKKRKIVFRKCLKGNKSLRTLCDGPETPTEWNSETGIVVSELFVLLGTSWYFFGTFCNFTPFFSRQLLLHCFETSAAPNIIPQSNLKKVNELETYFHVNCFCYWDKERLVFRWNVLSGKVWVEKQMKVKKTNKLREKFKRRIKERKFHFRLKCFECLE